jgi:FkbM family methyltransferase
LVEKEVYDLLFLSSYMILKFYHLLIRILPFKLQLIKFAASLPAPFKTSILFRIVSNMATYCNQATIVKSNLGINAKYRVNVSISHPIAAFGTPKLYTQEYATLFLLKELLKHSEAFIDVGANLGYFCFYIDEYNPSNKPIHFFEPDPVLFEQLQINQQKNQKNFIAHKRAISNSTGAITFYRNLTDDSSGSIKNTFENKHQLEAVSIDSISFDEFASSITEKKLLIKVDVEGAEFEFIEGAKNKIGNIDYLVIELLQGSIDHHFPKMMIEEYQFHAYYINNFNLEYSKAGEYTYVSPYYNWLFSKYEPATLKKKLANTAFVVVG